MCGESLDGESLKHSYMLSFVVLLICTLLCCVALNLHATSLMKYDCQFDEA